MHLRRTSSERINELKTQLTRSDTLLELLQHRQKIMAIKLLREDTGASLREAKETVESLIEDYKRAGILPFNYDAPVTNRFARFAASTPTRERDIPPMDAAIEQEIRNLLWKRQKIMAIKLYRVRTGASLKEGKEAVEAIEARMQMGR